MTRRARPLTPGSWEPRGRPATRAEFELSRLGFIAIDGGSLDASRTVDGAADFVRFQIAKMGLGPYVTLSVNVLAAPQ